MYSWRSKSAGDEDGRAAQIDMVIELADNTINICEMKFSEGMYAGIVQNEVVLDDLFE